MRALIPAATIINISFFREFYTRALLCRAPYFCYHVISPHFQNVPKVASHGPANRQKERPRSAYRWKLSLRKKKKRRSWFRVAGDVFVRLSNVSKRFDRETTVVNDLSLEIEQGRFVTLLGPSGCGKTTTLRLIAGFETPTAGTIVIDGEDVTLKLPHERCVNTVFQSYALFPHMNVYDNIAFGLKMKGVRKDEIRSRVSEMLRMVRMEGFESRIPSQLSGGQMQRVAIARAVINNPKVLLLDEPLGALDLKLRKQMQLELKRLQRKLGITFLFVTHDQEEALSMSDTIVVMRNGTVEQTGAPEELYERPKNAFVAGFLGETNIIEGRIRAVEETEAVLVLEQEERSFRIPNPGYAPGEACSLSVRPERIRLTSSPDDGESWLRCTVRERIYSGSLVRTIATTVAGKDILVDESLEQRSRSTDGGEIFAAWKPEHAVPIRA